MFSIKTLLKLGRVSNLPTVWSNCLLAALVSAHASSELTYQIIFDSNFLFLLLAGSLAYVGGMFLNDAFDAPYDRVHQNFRPIPSSEINRSTVFVLGFSLLGISFGFFLYSAIKISSAVSTEFLLASAGLYFCIVVYDAIHKATSLSVLLMAGARGFLILLAGSALTAPGIPLALAAAASFLYICSLTIVARLEDTLTFFKGKIGLLIAGVCILDGVLVFLLTKQFTMVPVFIGLYIFTIKFQKKIRGT